MTDAIADAPAAAGAESSRRRRLPWRSIYGAMGLMGCGLLLSIAVATEVEIVRTAHGLRVASLPSYPALWSAVIVLFMFGAAQVLIFWNADRRRERELAHGCARAQLRLAHVVCELDALQLRTETAKSALKKSEDEDARARRLLLRREWRAVQRLSLRAAEQEQRLQRIFRERAELDPGQSC